MSKSNNKIPGPDTVIDDKSGQIETMTGVIMYIANQSSVVKDNDVILMVEACNILMPSVAKAWKVTCPIVKYIDEKNATSEIKKETDWLFHIIDTDASVPDALAFHTVENNLVDGYILAKTIMDNGGVLLYGGDENKEAETIASALFHELVEALGDPECNAWWKNNKNTINSLDTNGNPTVIKNVKYVAAELCDPVQGNIVVVTLSNGTKVGLSDFVLPAWSEPTNKTGPYNYTETLKAPFVIDKGGYAVYKDSKKWKSKSSFRRINARMVKRNEEKIWKE